MHSSDCPSLVASRSQQSAAFFQIKGQCQFILWLYAPRSAPHHTGSLHSSLGPKWRLVYIFLGISCFFHFLGICWSCAVMPWSCAALRVLRSFLEINFRTHGTLVFSVRICKLSVLPAFMCSAFKYPINAFTSTLESFGVPSLRARTKLGAWERLFSMHSSKITTSEINPVLNVKHTT